MDDQLPDDIILKILSKLPAKAILRFKCVCKLWSNIVDSPSLANLHLNEGVEKPRLLWLVSRPSSRVSNLLTYKDDERYLRINSVLFKKKSNSKYFSLVGSCNGILCFLNDCLPHDKEKAFLFNPLRQQVLSLPSLSSSWLSFIGFGLGFDSTKNTYKIVCIYENQIRTLDAQVLTLGTSSSSSWSWRALISKVPARISKYERFVFACGVVHWISDVNNDVKIVAFHVEKEEFSVVSCPPAIFISNIKINAYLVELGGCLGFVYDHGMIKHHTSLWIMKDYDKKEWVNLFHIERVGYMKVLGIFEDKEVLVKLYPKGFAVYSESSRCLRKIPIIPNDLVYLYSGSLFSLPHHFQL